MPSVNTVIFATRKKMTARARAFVQASERAANGASASLGHVPRTRNQTLLSGRDREIEIRKKCLRKSALREFGPILSSPHPPSPPPPANVDDTVIKTGAERVARAKHAREREREREREKKRGS